MSGKKSVAIIGAGIAGLSAAFHLHKSYDVWVYEKESKLGGHTDTHTLSIDGIEQQIDSGFIVFCKQYYPHFSAMLERLGVKSKPTTMSFSAHNLQSGVVYNAASLNKLFCQRKNLVSLRFYRMLLDIVRFYWAAPKVLENQDHEISVATYLRDNNYSEGFCRDHLLPMISALWSATPQRVAEFPIRHLVEFLHSHGMLKLLWRPAWEVIEGGSDVYVRALQDQIRCQWRTNSKVSKVVRNPAGITVETENGEQHGFHAVVFATHADQALRILDQPSEDERRILGNIKFEKNHVVVHTDESIMHPNKAAWACWNTEVPDNMDKSSLQCCTANYWMNLLQGLEIETNVFATLNSHHKINPRFVLAERNYTHPIFTADSVASLRQREKINGVNQTYYVGAYWGWGFHEDGARSAAQASQLIKQQII